MLLNQSIQDLAQFYGQTAHFTQCVRNRQSFCQMQRAKLSVKFTARLFWVISIIASVVHTKKTGLDLRLTAIIRFFILRHGFFPASFLKLQFFFQHFKFIVFAEGFQGFFRTLQSALAFAGIAIEVGCIL